MLGSRSEAYTICGHARMRSGGVSAVTGAFGFSGRYIARRLLTMGRRVRTLTRATNATNPFGSAVEVWPLCFDRPDELAGGLRGVETLFNTYWVRFEHGRTTFDLAVRNTRILLEAAVRAGVRRVVHVSVANPSADSPFPYFRGKAQTEDAVIRSGMSYAILRPAVVFGPEDILINNIAYFLRRSPVFAVPGKGDYRVQPIYVEDFAELAVAAGDHSANTVVEAAGPEVFTFHDLVRLLRNELRSRTLLLRGPPALAIAVTRLLGLLVGDVVLTRDEVYALMSDLLVSPGPPTGWTRLSEWVASHRDSLGAHYASELARHFAQADDDRFGRASGR